MRPTTMLLFLVWCGSVLAQKTSTVTPPADSAKEVVLSYYHAVDVRDLPGAMALFDTGFVWLIISGDTLQVQLRGMRAVEASLEQYLKPSSSSRSVVEEISALGPWVMVRERAYWQSKTGERSQASYAVYEVRNNHLMRVWYYPSVR